ncbi:MAG: hypothetical protein ACRC68_05570 [Clostridium sp.]
MDIKTMLLERVFDIPKEKRIKVGKYIKQLREEKNKTLSVLEKRGE